MTKREKGITLIALVITVIVLIILAAISLATLTGENGLITKAQLSKFATEMKAIEENVNLKKSENEMYNYLGEVTDDLFSTQLNVNQIDIPDTLKQEILYTRDGMPSDKEPLDYDVTEFDENLVDEEGNVDSIYIIDEETGNGKENTYIYDERTGVVFKIPQTSIGGKIYHSYDCAISEKGSLIGESVTNNNIITESSSLVTVNNVTYYAPDLSGFDSKYTSVVYYSSDFSEIQKVVASEYITRGQQNTIENGQYTLHNYGSQIWANAVTEANGVEAWWVWIPRYAYKINAAGDISIAYIDVDNNDLNNTEGFEEYIIHSAFEGNDLKGIWMSKFEPTNYQDEIESKNASSVAYAPDMEGFDTENTYMVYYSEDFSDTYQMLLSEYNSKSKPRTIQVNGETYTLYDYGKRIWANIVTKANGVEAWWVWIPRYAYNADLLQTEEMSIIFVDANDKPYDASTLSSIPDGYEVHSAFAGNTLKGIWMSKFEPTTYRSSAETDNADNTAYAPDMEGFDTENTYMVYYSEDFSDTYQMLLSEYNSKSKPRTIDVDGETYTLYDYRNHIWANIVTKANGVEAWWVWIPRYAYNADLLQTEEMSIIFVDTNDKPYDTSTISNLPDGYEVHSAFAENDLKGLWMSKFEPTYDSSTTTSSEDTTLSN